MGDPRADSTLRKPLGARATSPFVGREEELRRLSDALTLAAQGQGSTIFLTGQPGIGKTRLARQALALAKERGFRVLEARAYPMEAGLSYAPILEAFGPLLRSFEPATLEVMVRGLPDLGRLFGGLDLPPPDPLGDYSLEKTRLYEAVTRLLERLTQSEPIALFLDDLHRSDAATLGLFHYLTRGVSDQRALLVATYGNLDASPELKAMSRTLERAGLAEEITVMHMQRDTAYKLVQGRLGGEAPDGLLSLLHARAGGTPLFLEALVDALIDAGALIRGPALNSEWFFDAERVAPLPPSVRGLIVERLNRLPSIQRHALDTIAVMADATSHAVLRTVSDIDEDALLDALRYLRVAGLVIDGEDGLDVTYSLTHPLVQEVAYAELPEMERRQTHLAAIRVLERFAGVGIEDPSIPVSEIAGKAANRLAYHYRGAGAEAPLERALQVLVAAGQRALYLYANDDAANHFIAALAMLRGVQTPQSKSTVPRPPAPHNDEPFLPWLLERLGQAFERIGKWGAAVEVWSEALVERKRCGNNAAAARLHRQLALTEWDRGHFDIASAHLESGLALLTRGPSANNPSQELADLYYARFLLGGQQRDAVEVAETAAMLLKLAKQVSSSRVEAQAHLVASMSCIWRNDFASARLFALGALRAATQAEEPSISCAAHATLAHVCIRLGDQSAMRFHANQGLLESQRLGATHVEVNLRSRLAYHDFLAGSLQDSLRNSVEAIALARRTGNPRELANALSLKAMIHILQGRIPEAEALLCEVRSACGSGTRVDNLVSEFLNPVETTLALEQGQVVVALGIAQDYAWPTAVTLEGSVRAPHGFVPGVMPMGLMLLAEAQIAAGDAHNALDTARQLSELGPPDSSFIIAYASRAEGLVRQALGQHEAAVASLSRAIEHFNLLEMRFEAARCQLEVARSAISFSPEQATMSARESLAIFQQLGALRYADRARQLLRELGISPPAARRIRPSGTLLSERELEIARLVADGLSAPEISRRLCLSRRTVSTHFENIYTRLRIHSRAALARYVIESGFITPPSHT